MFSSSEVAVVAVLPSVVEEAVEESYSSKVIQSIQDKLIL
jgi:hypothetical protein|tara:strand:+ start:32 stop:151 length:120 start_codon:yes stop_codon:yes gene_type:complete